MRFFTSENSSIHPDKSQQTFLHPHANFTQSITSAQQSKISRKINPSLSSDNETVEIEFTKKDKKKQKDINLLIAKELIARLTTMVSIACVTSLIAASAAQSFTNSDEINEATERAATYSFCLTSAISLIIMAAATHLNPAKAKQFLEMIQETLSSYQFNTWLMEAATGWIMKLAGTGQDINGASGTMLGILTYVLPALFALNNNQLLNFLEENAKGLHTLLMKTPAKLRKLYGVVSEIIQSTSMGNALATLLPKSAQLPIELALGTGGFLWKMLQISVFGSNSTFDLGSNLMSISNSWIQSCTKTTSNFYVKAKHFVSGKQTDNHALDITATTERPTNSSSVALLAAKAIETASSAKATFSMMAKFSNARNLLSVILTLLVGYFISLIASKNHVESDYITNKVTEKNSQPANTINLSIS